MNSQWNKISMNIKSKISTYQNEIQKKFNSNFHDYLKVIGLYRKIRKKKQASLRNIKVQNFFFFSIFFCNPKLKKSGN